MKAGILLICLIKCFQLFSQAELPCRISLEYCYENKSRNAIDSSKVNVILQIPNQGRDVDYRINYSEIWSVEFIQEYCNNLPDCSVDQVIKKLSKQGKSAIIVEFSDGYFEFLSALSGAFTHYSNVNLVENYSIHHLDKQSSFLSKEIYPNCSIESFSWGESFRLHVVLLEDKKCSNSSVRFVTDWHTLLQLLGE